MLKWNISKSEYRIVREIAVRAFVIAHEAGSEYTIPDCEMDITAAHLNGCPLRLAELLEADRFNFTHDVFGIRGHLNRETGELKDCFVPRYARPQAA